MSSIGAVSSGMTHAMMMKPPPGPPSTPPPGVRNDPDSDGDGDGDGSSSGKKLDIKA